VNKWAERIRTQLGKTVEAIIEVGRLLVKAKGDLEHGEWGRLFEDGLVPFTQNTAQRLMLIAEHPQLSNTAHVQHLPPSWGTLYELTKVEPKRLTAALNDGTITPNMKRSAVAELLPTRKKRSARRRRLTLSPPPQLSVTVTPAVTYRTAGSALCIQIVTMLSDGLEALLPEEQADVLSMVGQAIENMRQELQSEVGV
jgi:hypothetical protein